MSSISYQLFLVNPSDINLADRRFVFSFPQRKDLLIESIRELGLIVPPILYSTGHELIVISGEGRIQACVELSVQRIPVLVINEQMDERLLLLISLESNLFRGLNLVEKALFLERAKKFFAGEELLRFLPKIGLSPSKHWLFLLEKVLSLEEPFLIRLAEDKLNPKVVEFLVELSQSERFEFLDILEKIHLSYSEQREVLEILLDHRRNTSGSEFIPEYLKSILHIGDKNERKRQFFDALRGLRYPYSLPVLRKLEEIRNHFKKYEIDVTFSPYLEKREITLNFKVSSKAELDGKIEALKGEGSLLFSVFEENFVVDGNCD